MRGLPPDARAHPAAHASDVGGNRHRRPRRAGAHRPRYLGRSAYLRAVSTGSLRRAGVRAGRGPSVSDGPLEARRRGAAVRGARGELRRARCDDPSRAVSRRSEHRMGRAMVPTRRRSPRRSFAASTRGWPSRASVFPKSSCMPDGSRSRGRRSDLLSRTDAFVASRGALEEIRRAGHQRHRRRARSAGRRAAVLRRARCACARASGSFCSVAGHR